MRRWNGWGDDQIDYPFPDSAARFLADRIGQGISRPDISIEAALDQVPTSRLKPHPLITDIPHERLLHARGQSLPDWVALRSGRIGIFPDGVAYPISSEQVRSLILYARQTGASLIPYGGGTSVVGHINPLPGDLPVLTIDLSRMNQLLSLDETDELATFGAGVCGPELERQLNQRGYTLGHFPQSFELSTLGGWIATRSSGQQSCCYGRIEHLFAGGQVETPIGPLNLPHFPASAAGPDMRQLLLGSEGRCGVITQATVRIRPIPQVDAFYGIFFHSWEEGLQAVRQIAQSGVPISMARLSNALETETTLQLSGKVNLVSWAERGLSLLRYNTERSLLVMGITGDSRSTLQTYRQALAILRQHGGLHTGTAIGKIWRKSRFLTPYLRNTLWAQGYAIDTLETALPWSKLLLAEEAVLRSLHESLAAYQEKVLAFAHLSHIYRDGASLYVTTIFRRSIDPDETLSRWQAMKTAASQTIQACGGTISHQHGVGLDHAAYLPAEKGPLGMAVLRQVAKTLDPDGLLNPGKLFPEMADVE